MNDIIAILTSDDKDDIKSRVKNLIVDQVERDFNDYDMYCFNPDYIESLVGDVFTDIIEELKPTFKKAIKKKMDTLINEMKLPNMEI